MKQIRFSTVMLAVAFALQLVISWAVADDGKSSDSKANQAIGELTWNSGDRLPGRPIGLSKKGIEFESPLFRQPLSIGLPWLKRFDLTAESGSRVNSSEPFAIQLIDGQLLFADIKKLDDRFMTLESERAGQFAIDRKQIFSVVDQLNSKMLMSGALDLDQWNAKRGEKRYWKQNAQGDVVATLDDVHLFFESELPESCLIDLEVAWDEELDFALGMEIPNGARSLGSIPRLETWQGSVIFYHDGDFEIVKQELGDSQKSLRLLIHWDRKTNKFLIYDDKGEELASAEVSEFGRKAKPGLFLLNKSGDLKVKSIGIRSSAAGFDPSRTSVQLRSRDANNALIESFNGEVWTARKSNGDSIEFPKDEFIGAFRFNPDARFRTPAADILRFSDGEKVVGNIVAIDRESISVQMDVSAQHVTLNSAGLRRIQFEARKSESTEQRFNQVLITESGKLRGRLEGGKPTDKDVLFWRVEGAAKAVPFASGTFGTDRVNARIIVEKDDSKTAVENKWPDTLYLNNRDLLAVKLATADEQGIVVDSFFDNRKIPGNQIRAIELGAEGQPHNIAFKDDEWITKGRAKLVSEKFSLKPKSAIGHSSLMGRGGFEFDLEWPSDKYGILKVQFGRSIGTDAKVKDDNSNVISIMLYGEQFFVSESNDVQNPGRNLRRKNGKAVRFRFELQKDRLAVYGNNRKCLGKKLAEGFGRATSIQLDDMWNMQVSCKLSNLELAEGFISAEYIDSSRKELALTIPRLKARNPPSHILCARNFDLARGTIESINDQHVMFRSGSLVNRYPRDLLSAIVWIDTETLTKTLAAEENEASGGTESTFTSTPKPKPKSEKSDDSTSKARQRAQVLMVGGRRVTLELDQWADDKLIGSSDLLGKCEIPFDQIIEIRMGKYASEATDVPWSDWVAKLAPKPNLESGAGPGESGSGTFGTSSPLIGTSPKLSLKMLDGKDLDSKKLKGKIVVLDFWATWCGPCVKSLPDIKAVVDRYPESAVQLIAVNQNESKAVVRKFLKSRDLDLTVALDDGEISEQFDVEAIPQTVIIDANGTIRFLKVGVSNDMEKKLKAAIDSLLNTSSSL